MKEKATGNKPNTIDLWTYILFKLAKLEERWQRRRGMWYCAHCHKMHHKRVIEYRIADGLVDSVCSLGRDEYLKPDPELADYEQYAEKDFRPFVAGKPLRELVRRDAK